MDADHRQGPVRRATRSSISAKARSARCASTTTSSASSTSPTAGSVKRRTWTCLTSPTCASIRSSAGLAQQRNERRRAAILRLVQVPVLALRVRPAGDGQGTPDLPRIPADAAGRELQPRRRESGDGEKDGTGARRQRPRPVTGMTFTAGGSQGPPAFRRLANPFARETRGPRLPRGGPATSPAKIRAKKRNNEITQIFLARLALAVALAFTVSARRSLLPPKPAPSPRKATSTVCPS